MYLQYLKKIKCKAVLHEYLLQFSAQPTFQLYKSINAFYIICPKLIYLRTVLSLSR